jgi:hypothetical protein
MAFLKLAQGIDPLILWRGIIEGDLCGFVGHGVTVMSRLT